MNITDVDGTAITYLYFLLTESTDGPSLVIRAPGGPGRFLKADSDSSLRVKGRRAGTADSFVDLASTPLELAWADPANVEIKTHANAVSNFEQRSVSLRSTLNP